MTKKANSKTAVMLNNDKIMFNSESKAIKHLREVDIVLGTVISQIGDYTLNLRTDYFSFLLRCIIGQQLSFYAARAIWERFLITCGDITPERIIDMDSSAFKSIGVSQSKITYLKELSYSVTTRDVIFSELIKKDDLEIIKILTDIKGIGTWTAQMFLIFSLGRINVLPVNDVGIQRAYKFIYKCKSEVKDKIKISGKIWSPYQSLAAFYLWEVINNGFIKQ